jgi:hypothetical protein
MWLHKYKTDPLKKTIWAMLWDVMPHGLVEVHWCFREMHCLHLRGQSLLLVALWPWKLRQNDPTKHRQSSARLYGITSHKKALLKIVITIYNLKCSVRKLWHLHLLKLTKWEHANQTAAWNCDHTLNCWLGPPLHSFTPGWGQLPWPLPDWSMFESYP